MLPLMEMLRTGGDGMAVDRLARQFDLSREQAETAMAALTPAFSEALKRNASDPAGFMKFMQALSAGRHEAYFDRPDEALSDTGRQEGEAILGHLFGSKELSRAVAAQAEQFSGLSQDMLKQMLPALAPMILGGIFKQMTGGPPGAHQGRHSGAADAAHNPLGWLLEQMGGQGGPAGPTGGAANPWGDMLEQMMGGGRPRTRAEPEADPNPMGPMGRIFEEMMRGGGAVPGTRPGPEGNPLGRIFEEMLGGGADRRAEHRPDPETRKREPESGRRPGGLEDLFGEMFDAGREVQRDYQNQMGSVFDEFLKGSGRR